jgi:hypothetical protein
MAVPFGEGSEIMTLTEDSENKDIWILAERVVQDAQRECCTDELSKPGEQDRSVQDVY